MGLDEESGPFCFMIGLSTSVFGDAPGREMTSLAARLGFTSIELNFTLLPKQVDDIIKSFSSEGLIVSSLHNFVPEPPEGERNFLLSDIDQELRKKALDLTIGTMRLAGEIGARAVILHMGQPRGWAFEADQNKLRELLHGAIETGEADELREDMVSARHNLPAAYLDNMLRSLDKLAPMAENMGMILGIENRYYFGQFPDHEELGVILQEFSGAPIGYWHDCGHARQIQYCGFGEEEENLRAFNDRLIGIHLHDTRLWDDHRIPEPEGDIDFSYLRPYISPQTILVLELSRNRALDAIPEGLSYLKSKGIE